MRSEPTSGRAAWGWPGRERHPDLVAIFQSRRGRVALLLRQTMVPLVEERREWLEETRRAARAVIAELRGAGLAGPCLVLQWRPLGQVAEILHGWRCCCDADPVRRAELTRVVERRLADLRFLASRWRPPELPAVSAGSEALRPQLDEEPGEGPPPARPGCRSRAAP